MRAIGCKQRSWREVMAKKLRPTSMIPDPSCLCYTWFTYSDNYGDRYLQEYASCDIHLATGCGPWENSGPTYQFSAILASRGIAHHLDDWGPKGGHEWPYWHHQMWEYVGQHF